MKAEFPKTLQEAMQYFSDEDIAFEFVRSMRWADGVPVCHFCGSKESYSLNVRGTWKCEDCRKKFSVRAGTIFEDSPIALSKWMGAFWLIVNAKNGISSYEIHRALGVTQKTGWFMLQRIRLAMQNGSIVKIGGQVEVDETFIGGKARNMHTTNGLRRQPPGASVRGSGGGKGLILRQAAGSSIYR